MFFLFVFSFTIFSCCNSYNCAQNIKCVIIELVIFNTLKN